MELPKHFLFQKPFREHHLYNEGGASIGDEILIDTPKQILFKSNKDALCVSINENRKLNTNYYIGIDWIGAGLAIYVEPKLNKDGPQTNYLAMLFSALKHPEVSKHTDDLFEIKWDSAQIEITQQQDLLTPLLVVQFLKVVKEIVRKGLKKSYYKVENNLYAKVKGKVLVSQTIKKNLLKNKPINTFCSYDEFGLNGLENRLLKKALVFIQRYLPTIKNIHSEKYSQEIFNYINPAFEFVSEVVDLNDVKYTRTNAFYKEYEEGLRLAKIILKRFGYNISNTQQQTIKTPPFWIDMSKLFELYVLGLLKDRFSDNVQYHLYYKGNELDYLLNDGKTKMVIDAKYRPLYQEEENWDVKDIRQISAYARLKEVYIQLGVPETELIDCLIIYPNQAAQLELKNNFKEIALGDFVGFYKSPIKLPVIEIHDSISQNNA
jgi:5-methylcytosine-specific restriction enzyme subunit McrC